MDAERSDDAFRAWMRDNLDKAAAHFGLSVTGEPVFGWALRSLSTTAWTADKGLRWLRVCSERTTDVADMREFWTGNVDANTITDVMKPRVLDWTEWTDDLRSVRAEVMTHMTGLPVSNTDALRVRLDLPTSWFAELRGSLDTLRTVPTERFRDRPNHESRIGRVFGDDVAEAFPVRAWETVHGDLHWNNVLTPDFSLLDWEFWGRGPVGTDPATLYVFTLLVPDVARQVWDTFADVLDSYDGHVALLGAASRILYRAEQGENVDLAEPVRELVDDVLKRHR